MRSLFAALILLSVFTLSGCTGFLWDHPVVLASDLTPSAVEGQWEGSWQSYELYDNGLIHFVISPAPVIPPPHDLPAAASTPAPGTTRYLAKVVLWHYDILVPECFQMVLISSTGADGQLQFHGERDLGPLMGSCKFDGFVDANKCVMSYVSREDFGTITMHRVVDVGK